MTTLRRIIMETAASQGVDAPTPGKGGSEVALALGLGLADDGAAKKKNKALSPRKEEGKEAKVSAFNWGAAQQEATRTIGDPGGGGGGGGLENKDKKQVKKSADEKPSDLKREPSEEAGEEAASRKRTREKQERSASVDADAAKALRPPPRNASKKYSTKSGEDEGSEADTGAGGGDKASEPPGNKKKSRRNEEEDAEEESAKKTKKNDSPADALTWVQCERCQKWRDVPTSYAKKLPKEWFCWLNTWEPQYASCDAKQKESSEGEDESDDDNKAKAGGNAAPALGEERKKKKRREGEDSGKTKRNRVEEERPNVRASGKKDASNRDARGAGSRGKDKEKDDKTQAAKQSGNLRASITNMIAGGAQQQQRGNNMAPDKKEGKKNWNWVMCETCQQWRKLPPEVDVERLPEKWYCHMNKWDKLRATCSAPQEADDQVAGVEDPEQAAPSQQYRSTALVRLPDGVNLYGGQFFPATAKGNRKNVPLNYRELIVNHYRHFSKYDISANSFFNARYQDSSMFVPRGNVRGKNAAALTKKQVEKHVASSSAIAQSSRPHLGIASAALVRHTTFRKIFGLSPDEALGKMDAAAALKRKAQEDKERDKKDRAAEDGNEMEEEQEEEEAEEDADEAKDAQEQIRLLICGGSVDGQLPPALLKISKPWKRAGGWMEGSDYYCVRKGTVAALEEEAKEEEVC